MAGDCGEGGASVSVISNCVINLSTDKPAVLAERYRVLVPGGRIGITDVVAEDHLTLADRAVAGSKIMSDARLGQEIIDTQGAFT
jgi:hypothetical protein